MFADLELHDARARNLAMACALVPSVRSRHRRNERRPGSSSAHRADQGQVAGQVDDPHGRPRHVGDAAGIDGWTCPGRLRDRQGNSAAAAWASSTRPGSRRSNRLVRPEDDPGRRPRRRGRAGSASAPRPRRSPGLQHPNIVQVYEVGEHDGQPFFALEFCAGGSLRRASWRGTPLPPSEAAELVRDAGAGHAGRPRGEGHPPRPEAGQRPADGRTATPKVTDFGLAKKLDEQGQTQTGAVHGHASYMAAGAGRGQEGRRARRRTSTRWGRSCTSA